MTNNFVAEKQGYSKHKLSKEDYAAKKMAEKSEVYKMIDDTINHIIDSPTSFKEYLDTQSRVDRYSAVNGLLIYNQKPNATQLKDFTDWSKEGVKINKGEKSISILEPVEYVKKDGTNGVSYNVKKVFDVSQTNSNRFRSNNLNCDMEKLIKIMLDTSPVPNLLVDDLKSPQMAAYFDDEKQTLFVKNGVGNPTFVAQAVAQELAHAYLSMNNDNYSRKDMGFNAVCASYMICKKFGVDGKDFNFYGIPNELKNKDTKEIRSELSKIKNVASEINSHISEQLYKEKQERSKEYER